MEDTVDDLHARMPQPEPVRPATDPTASVPVPAESRETAKRRVSSPGKFVTIAAALFCFELGVFLLIFPWVNDWTVTIASILPAYARSFWLNSYFRGAVSGLGVLNIWISIGEISRLNQHR